MARRTLTTTMLLTIMLLIYVKVKQKEGVFNSYKDHVCETLAIAEFSDIAKKYIYFQQENQSETLDAAELRRWLLNHNGNAKILNIDLYGPVTIDTLIFVVQLHQYTCRINYLLASLSDVEGIQDTVIVFSHSRVDNNLSNLIQSIQFCRILQLFYPYSIQAYPDEFPGFETNDCPPNLNIEGSEKLNCSGATSPDRHRQNRNPINVEVKHHWWWTANNVFSRLSHTIGPNGMVVFLEHNFYIYSNFLHTIYNMKTVAQKLPDRVFLSLGSQLDVTKENAFSFEFVTWDPTYHSNILAMDVSVWRSIVAHYDIFCLIDDHSWARSIFDVSINRREGKMFKVLSSVASRALQTASCLSIGDMMDCIELQNIIEHLNFQKIYRQYFFPPFFTIQCDIPLYEDEIFFYDDYIENNGGWNDHRDRQLCINMTVNKEQK